MPEITRLSTAQPDFAKRLAALTAFESTLDDDIERAVATIVGDVYVRGDAAVLEYTERFDRVKVSRVSELELPHNVLDKARNGLATDQRKALEDAAARIRGYHERQRVRAVITGLLSLPTWPRPRWMFAW